MPSLQPTRLTHQALCQAYTTSPNRLLLFDYDGTLTPIVPHPPSAILSTQARHYLTRLANNPRNTVWVISGRPSIFLTQHLGTISPRLGLFAEHGAFVREPGSNQWISLSAVNGEELGWREIVCSVFEELVRAVEGSELEAKAVAVVWHFRRAVDVELATAKAKAVIEELKDGPVGRKWDVEVVDGKCVVEVRARRLGKGSVVKRIVDGERPRKWGFVGCWGDDRTDEDMFQALAESSLNNEGVFSVKVGDDSTSTRARWIVADPEEVLDCLKWLTDADDASDCSSKTSQGTMG